MSPTEEYAERFPAMPFVRWNGQILASQYGIGTYRMNLHEPEHIVALAHALRSGINVVDTATNYSDGHAEELIGHVLEQLHANGYAREHFVIVSKAGYVQGRNLNRAIKREHQGHAFPHMVKLEDDLWHCIHPEFLQDQLDRSLRHMRTHYVDAYLLHNPEYFLINAQREAIPLGEARAEFYYRIELAFRYLENEARARRIRWYGVSSNAFGLPTHDERFVSLEQLWDIALQVGGREHHFRVVQAPLNILEPSIAIEQNNSGRTFLEYAHEQGLVVMVNRALNAVVNNSLVRLAIHAASSEPAPSPTDIAARLAEAMQMEDHFTQHILPTLPFEDESKELLRDYLSPATQLASLWERFETVEHWHDAETQFFAPRIREATEAIATHASETVQHWMHQYRTMITELFGLLTRYYAHRALPRLQAIEHRVKDSLGEPFSSMGITELALAIPRATVGVTCTLVGARRRAYVDHVCTIAQQHLPPLERHHWEDLAAVSAVVKTSI
ncbi:MAG: aldo/keto reductase [Bacteroidota bacterium]|nr:aldo/keto reductase [Candidatus Kapabacteria bacterium]MCS7303347.1 aldo/keto reductase [Candidatus Kapabacteria bacterium]MCX7937352.1 aldo/keto reductase [Chlorobiota bacterium]MDW8075871.1 aldo/keto reductase [Bacteroidota bacterium]MDW8271809.1 aldo/keto reductase [Bacteroidota bacterium]